MLRPLSGRRWVTWWTVSFSARSQVPFKARSSTGLYLWTCSFVLMDWKVKECVRGEWETAVHDQINSRFYRWTRMSRDKFLGRSWRVGHTSCKHSPSWLESRRKGRQGKSSQLSVFSCMSSGGFRTPASGKVVLRGDGGYQWGLAGYQLPLAVFQSGLSLALTAFSLPF